MRSPRRLRRLGGRSSPLLLVRLFYQRDHCGSITLLLCVKAPELGLVFRYDLGVKCFSNSAQTLAWSIATTSCNATDGAIVIDVDRQVVATVREGPATFASF